MYAIVEIGGHQYKVAENDVLFVNRRAEDVDSSVTFDKVLLVSNDGATKVGTPVVENASVQAKIVEHCRADKVLVFKKKRRKGYQKMNGHRQDITKLQIEKVNA